MNISEHLDTKELEEMLFEKPEKHEPDCTVQDESVHEFTSQKDVQQFSEKIYSENQHAFEKFGMTREGLDVLGKAIDETCQEDKEEL